MEHHDGLPPGRTVDGGVSRRRVVRDIGLVTAGLLPGAALVACADQGGSGGQASTPVAQKATIEMWFFHDQWKAAFDEVIGNFQRRHPNLTVNFSVPAEGVNQKLTVALAGGNAPDITSVNWDMVRTLSQQKSVLDLSPDVAKDKAFAADLAAYHPKIQALMQWEGKQRGVGLDHDDIALFWNVTRFKQLQLRPLTDIHEKWTWNDLVDIARQVTTKAEQQYGFYGHNTTGQTGYWSFVYANGGNVLTDDGSKADPMLEAPAQDAIQWIADTRLKHGAAPTDDEIKAVVGSTSAVTLFQQGKLAMVVDGSWRVNSYVTAITGFEWDVAHLPLAPRTGKRSSVLHGTGFSVIQDSRVRDAAVLYAKHLSTRETHKVYGATGIIQSARRDEWDGFYASKNLPQHRNVLREAVEYAHQHPLTGQWGIRTYEAVVPLITALGTIYSGQVAVKAGLQEGVREYNALMAGYVANAKR